MTKTKIEWADYTWNPIMGCKNNCSYCYGKTLNQRFEFVKEWSVPQFFPEKLKEPFGLKNPSSIFVGSMCDIMGDGVQYQWIEQVIDVAEKLPQHRFLFLTKLFDRFIHYRFPANCWLGATITKPSDWNIIYQIAVESVPNHTFASVEPLLGDFTGFDFKDFDYVIVGAMTGAKAIKPTEEWIDSIKHRNIFYKKNLYKFK